MTEEKWLPIAGYAGFYEISDHGRVFSMPRSTTRGGLKKQALTKKGYAIVTLSKYSHLRTYLVHQLVLEAFVGPRPPGQQGCHGPNGRADNSVLNLYWGSPERNQGPDRVRDGTSNCGERSASAVLTEVIVADCRRRYLAGETQATLCAQYGISSGAMSHAIHGVTWACVTDPPPVSQDRDGRSYRNWTPERREQMRQFGRAGAEARWT